MHKRNRVAHRLARPQVKERRPADWGHRSLLSQFQLFRPPACALAAETLNLERAVSDLVNPAY